MGKNNIDIPIVKDGKDICRLIFTRDEAMQGRYDLKLDFRKNLYEVWIYRKFARYPVIWDVEHSENVSMTYHHGANDNPIVIHLKNESPDEEHRYRTLPASHIQAPNINTMFPIPLCKIEIPSGMIERAQDYRKKARHYPVDMGEMNVLEVFMVSEEFDFSEFAMKKYSQIFSCQMFLSFEYYASYTVLSDYAKALHFIPEHGVAEERMIVIGELNGMKLVVNKFCVPEIDSFADKVHVTFAENELAEDVLLCTLCKYPPINLLTNEYDKIYVGSASLEQLQPPSLLLARMPVLPESCADWALRGNLLDDGEKSRLEERAGTARWRMYRELKKHENDIQRQGADYRRRAYLFRDALAVLKRQSVENAEIREGVRYMDEKQAWLASDWCVHTYEIHMLFAKFLELQEYDMQVCRITHQDYVEPERPSFTMDKEGTMCGTGRTITRENTIFDHVWLRIDDYFEIDITRDALDICCEKDGGNKQIPVLVSRSRFYVQNDPWDGMRKRLEDNGFICESPRYKRFKKEDTEAFFRMKNGLYESIYRDIMMVYCKDNKCGKSV